MCVAAIKKIIVFSIVAFWCSCTPNENTIMKIREVALSDLYQSDPYYHLYMLEFNGRFDSAAVDSINQFVAAHFSKRTESVFKREYVIFMEYDPTVYEAINFDKAGIERIEWYHHLLLLAYEWKDGEFVYTALHRRGNKSVYEIIKTSPFDSAGADQ